MFQPWSERIFLSLSSLPRKKIDSSRLSLLLLFRAIPLQDLQLGLHDVNARSLDPFIILVALHRNISLHIDQGATEEKSQVSDTTITTN